jgi:hypothetical protein
MTTRMSFPRRALALIPLLFLLAACNLTSQNAATPTANSAVPPSVSITSPRDGEQVAVNQVVLVSVTATDNVGVTRVQLLANGLAVRSETSANSGGDRVFTVVFEYTPTQMGTLLLQAIAFRGSVSSTAAEIRLNVGTPPTATRAPATSAPPIIITSPPNPIDLTCRLQVNAPLNLRTGPDVVFPRILVLNTGTVAPITGRTPDNGWWQVRVGTTTGWVSNQFVTLFGNCSSVIIPPLPPTPTSQVIPSWTPTLTLTPTVIQPPTATPTTGLPDLVVPTITGETVVALGAGNTPVTRRYTVTITNTGGGIAGQFNNTISLPAGGTMALGVVAGLRPGETIALTADITFTTPGTFTLQARADSDSQVTEISEVNNIGFISITVNPSP